jgi:flavin-dependent dehydrogenase
MWDVIVAGAGPAGAVASFFLARAGCRTLLVDKVDNRSEKIGETLPGAAVRLLRSFGLPAPETEGPHKRVGVIFSSWNSDGLLARDSIRDPYGPAWRLDRRRFDADLRQAAIAAGTTYWNKEVIDLQRQFGNWSVQFCDGEIVCASWIVDATGRRAALARRLGVNRIRDKQLIAFYGVGRADATPEFDRTIVEATSDGWWYVARLPSGAPMAGFHTDARKASHLRTTPGAWIAELAKTQHVSQFASPEAFDNPLRALDARGSRLADFEGDGWIACGEAAMCFDPIAGQGIFSAIQSGYAAATSVVRALSLGGEGERPPAYSERMNDVWAVYHSRSQAVYRSERRWRSGHFWSRER